MEPVKYNPISKESIANPYPMYSRLREATPVYKTPLGVWIVTAFEEASFILNDKRFGKPVWNNVSSPELDRPTYNAVRHWMMFSNPPEHTRQRRHIIPGFSRKRIEAMKPRIEAIVDELIDSKFAQGKMEFIADFARPLPIIVTCDLLGIPIEDRHLFEGEKQLLTKLIGGLHMSPEELTACDQQIVDIHKYFSRLIEAKRADPQDDLISLVAHKNDETMELSDIELVSNLYLLFLAGYETTSSFLGNAILRFFQNTDQLEKLKADLSLLSNSVSEMLRYENSILHVSRSALEDIELAGQSIKKGDVVWVSLAAGNRDPALYNNPDELDIERNAGKVLSFGGGIHRCLGEYLARVEVEVAIEKILNRLPELKVMELDQPMWSKSIVFRGLTTLQLKWTVV